LRFHSKKETPVLRKTLSAAFAALLGFSLLSVVTLAQDATPAGDCAVTTPEENVGIVQGYIDAVLAGDTAAADALLHDDFVHDLSMEGAEVPNEPGNADELANVDIAAGVNFQLVKTLAQADWVAADMEFDLSGENLGLAAADQVARVEVVVLLRIECGTIAEAQFTTSLLEALLSLGYELTPPAE
jgi:ketosteroid isomerase-like protein